MTTNFFLNICYEPITDRFWYGEIDGYRLIIDSQTGFLNATKLVASQNKGFFNWKKNKQSKQYMEYLKQCHDIVTYEIRGGSNLSNLLIRGTYVCKELIKPISTWISPECSVKIEKIIEDYFTGLENALEDISPKVDDINKRELFVLLQTNDTYPYYAIRCQRRSKNSAIKKLREKYPDLIIILEISYDPNAVNLFNIIKENVKDISTFQNGIKLLNGYTIDNFKRDLKKITFLKTYT